MKISGLRISSSVSYHFHLCHRCHGYKYATLTVYLSNDQWLILEL